MDVQNAFVAQLAEHRTCNAGVVGSTPIEGSNVGIAQLVQSACLIRRRFQVRVLISTQYGM